ncbi:hypothetical protein A8926_1877 [Saccharopolyspora spinosa]|uniref:Uncharacterized protein n=1 Tax=Saccharopolyspora spinosa TaxID=60894 RepID=A0A2N3XUF1_SACSN|nr:hypothetical protein A8926_1877 [Saccharopolyspora spinosa]
MEIIGEPRGLLRVVPLYRAPEVAPPESTTRLPQEQQRGRIGIDPAPQVLTQLGDHHSGDRYRPESSRRLGRPFVARPTAAASSGRRPTSAEPAGLGAAGLGARCRTASGPPLRRCGGCAEQGLANVAQRRSCDQRAISKGQQRLSADMTATMRVPLSGRPSRPPPYLLKRVSQVRILAATPTRGWEGRACWSWSRDNRRHGGHTPAGAPASLASWADRVAGTRHDALWGPAVSAYYGRWLRLPA